MRIVQLEATHAIMNADLISIDNKPPHGLESPNFEQAKLENLIIIETENNDPGKWLNCRVLWRNKCWRIDFSLAIQNGEKALIKLYEMPNNEKQ